MTENEIQRVRDLAEEILVLTAPTKPGKPAKKAGRPFDLDNIFTYLNSRVKLGSNILVEAQGEEVVVSVSIPSGHPIPIIVITWNDEDDVAHIETLTQDKDYDRWDEFIHFINENYTDLFTNQD